jgi:hypothetical protein
MERRMAGNNGDIIAHIKKLRTISPVCGKDSLRPARRFLNYIVVKANFFLPSSKEIGSMDDNNVSMHQLLIGEIILEMQENFRAKRPFFGRGSDL